MPLKRLVLVGAGHAHLSVLEALAKKNVPGVEVILVTPATHQEYSGMLPGWIAGHYTLSQCRINLQALVRAGNIHMVTSKIVGMDADSHYVRLAGGQQIEYDILSLNTGSEIDTSMLEMAGDKLLTAKPMAEFFSAWPQVLEQAMEQADYRLLVVGGGAAGVELALAARHAFTITGLGAGLDRHVDLVVSEGGLLEGHAPGVRRRAAHFIDSVNIVVHELSAVGTAHGVLLADGNTLPADCVIAATGKRAPGWLSGSKLKLDEAGFIAVNGQQQSLSHTNVFAAGDVCARQDMAVDRSGVHAVHSGPFLASNLQAIFSGGTMKTYRPRRHSLYLLACGPQYALASWGPFSAGGKWVWRWKDRIDRRFVKRFQRPEI